MSIVIAGLAGLVIGATAAVGFFGGLWWTARRLVLSDRPGLLLTGSLVLRLALLGLCLVVVALLDPIALIGAVIGVLATRVMMTWAVSNGHLPSARLVTTSESEGMTDG